MEGVLLCLWQWMTLKERNYGSCQRCIKCGFGGTMLVDAVMLLSSLKSKPEWWVSWWRVSKEVVEAVCWLYCGCGGINAVASFSRGGRMLLKGYRELWCGGYEVLVVLWSSGFLWSLPVGLWNV